MRARPVYGHTLILFAIVALALIADIARTDGPPLTFSSPSVRPVTLYVPAFEGAESLGLNVATILNLQIWQTLRKTPFPNPRHLTFGNGLVTWDDRPLVSLTHEDAERAARQNEADLTLWGKAWHYGNGVVVQAYLTIAGNASRRLWQVSDLQAAGVVSKLSLGVPRLRYEFRPIVLSDELVKSYSNPGSLRIYASPTSPEAVGSVGSKFTALEQSRNSARVESDGVKGWIRLPALSESKTEIVDFAGGIIRVFRDDWDGAASLFHDVIANPKTPTTLLVDAHLYRGVALQRARKDGSQDFEAAYKLNPYDRSAVTFLLMSRIEAINLMAQRDPARARLVADARTLVASNRYLFPNADPWLRDVEEFLTR